MSESSQIQVIPFLKLFLERVKSDFSGCRGATRWPNQDFVHSHFWLLFRIACCKISKAALSIYIAFEQPPWPFESNTRMMLEELQTAYISLTDCASTLHSDQGDCLLTSVSVTVKAIQTSLIEFLTKLLPSIQNTRAPVDLTAIRVLLRECDQVEKLPKDNFQAVVDVLETTDNLISDIIDELTEELKNQINTKRSHDQGVQAEEVWSETEFSIVKNSLIMCKTFRRITLHSLNFVKKNLSKETNTALLDQLADASMELSPFADEFVSSVYPPTDDGEHIIEDLDNVVKAFQNYLAVYEKCPNMKEDDIALCANARERTKTSQEELKSLLVSNAVMDLSTLSLNQS